MATKISRAVYAEMFGPTVGDRVRLADTDLVIEVEKDFTHHGEEVKFGGGKVIRDGMGQSQMTNAQGAVDTVITNALIVDHWGVVKADADALYKLMAWFSPSYPIGAFSYSSGLEWAVEARDISDADTLLDWLKVMMSDGAGFCDGVFFAHAWRACNTPDEDALRMVIELAAALTPSRERFLETTAQGCAFLDATRAAWPCAALDRLAAMGEDALAYPVVAGAAAAGHDIPLPPALSAYLQALVTN